MNKKEYLENLELIKDENKVEEKLLEEIKKFNENEKQKIIEAMDFCKEKHFWQLRDEWTAYFSHPFFVAILWIRNNLDYIDIISLLLHDTLEDTETTKEEIEQKFWKEVMKNVYFLSKNYFGNKDEYYKNISESKNLQILKWLDRIANLHSLKFAIKEKQIKYLEKTRKEILSFLDKGLFVYNEISFILENFESL